MRHIESFLGYLQNEKRSSHHTQVAYQHDLEQFFAFLGGDETALLASVKPKTVRNWIVELHKADMSPRTIHRKISSVRTFFKYLQRLGIIDGNPAASVNLPKTPKRLPLFVKEQEMELLLDHTDFGDDYEGVRNKLILELFYDTGMRLSELVELRHRDVDLTEKMVKVLGKGNKERIIPLTNESVLLFKRYNDVKNDTFGTTVEPWLFLTSKGAKIYHKLVYRVVHSSLQMVTTMQKKSPHILRHTFATVLLNRGADLNAIKELLGHANLNATQVYAHNTFEKLNAIYKQAHPRAEK
ncbi:tyrosine-type recombinase/integrase [Geofilum sp. OHC36d9]|uniref:tyrosine-type recombinase/integrase n=1 Tax=Geofilum sp. OHC36d9 TaxID=3458413 RepID=UPI00403459B8